MARIHLTLLFVLSLSISTSVAQQPPALISFQGVLTDSLGIPVPDGSYDMTLRLYAASKGAVPLWEEPRSGADEVELVNGVYNVLLGEIVPLTSIVFNRPLWLGVETETEFLSPRVPLTSVPYSLGLRLPYAGVDTVAVSSVFKISNHGAGTGIEIDSAGTDGLVIGTAGTPVATGSSIQNNGVEVRGAEGSGYFVGRATNGLRTNQMSEDGVHVNSAGLTLTTLSAGNNGFEVGGAQHHGLWVGQAGNDGVHVKRVGLPPQTVASLFHNGFEVEGTTGNGLFVGYADWAGVLINRAKDHGIYIDQADEDGLTIHSVGSPSATPHPVAAPHIGINIDGVENTGIRIGRSDGNGMIIRSVAFTGIVVDSAITGARLNGTDADLWLGGTVADDNGKLISDPNLPSSDLVFESNDDIAMHLDEDGGENGQFVIVDQSNTEVFRVTEAGDVYAGVLVHSSDISRKEDFETVDPVGILESVAKMPVRRWKFRGADELHIGPTAQDFRAAFGLGENETSIATVDADGVALAAIQGLYEIIRKQEERISELERAARTR